MSFELLILPIAAFALLVLVIWFHRLTVQETVNSLQNIQEFTTDFLSVYFDSGIAFDYSRQQIAILVKGHIFQYHISQIREWQLQSTQKRESDGNIKGEHDFRIWLRIADINHPEVSLRILNAEQYHQIEEAILITKDACNSTEGLNDYTTSTAVILTAFGTEIDAILKTCREC